MNIAENRAPIERNGVLIPMMKEIMEMNCKQFQSMFHVIENVNGIKKKNKITTTDTEDISFSSSLHSILLRLALSVAK